MTHIVRPARTPAPGDHDEKGAVAVVVALLLAVFVALLAIVVDLALVRVERADAQGAADSAAQSAAWASCQGRSDIEARAAGEQVATANGFTNTQVQRTGDRWRATIDVTVPPAFSSLLTGGADLESTVAAEARSACRPSEPLPALFAGSQTCGDKTFVLSGSNSTIYGDIHSNDDLVFGGENTVEGEGTYVGTVKDPDKIDWVPSAANPRQDAVRAFPAEFELSDYQTDHWAGHYVSTGSMITESWLTSNGFYTSGVIKPGVYYSSTGFDLGSMQGAIGNVTFVSPQRIKLSPSDVQLTPYASGLLFFSDYSEPDKCDDWAIDISGSNNDWEGVIYAPKGLVKYAGSSGSTLSGSIIADTLELSGSGWSVTSPQSSQPGDATVLLMN